MSYHLAQLNIAHLLAPIDSPQLADFVAQIPHINALAEASNGFVWRMRDEDMGDCNPFDTQKTLLNMSVWETVESLKNFAYKSAHAPVMRNRTAWFATSKEAYMVLWWIPVGHIPTLQEAHQRLEHLNKHGETAYAFTFKKVFSVSTAI